MTCASTIGNIQQLKVNQQSPNLAIFLLFWPKNKFLLTRNILPPRKVHLYTNKFMRAHKAVIDVNFQFSWFWVLDLQRGQIHHFKLLSNSMGSSTVASCQEVTATEDCFEHGFAVCVLAFVSKWFLNLCCFNICDTNVFIKT